MYIKTIYDINEEFKKKYELSKEETKFFHLKEKIYIYTNSIKMVCKNNIENENYFLKDDKEKYIKNVKIF